MKRPKEYYMITEKGNQKVYDPVEVDAIIQALEAENRHNLERLCDAYEEGMFEEVYKLLTQRNE